MITGESTHPGLAAEPGADPRPHELTSEVVIVGAGPSGLRAATELAGSGVGVLVLERERSAGGIPRHCFHPGYGIRDLGRFLSGPRYAEIIRDRALSAGAMIMTEAMVTGWAGERALDVTAPQGRIRVSADAVVLATGARERPRSARLIPGDRSRGVFTTGQLQNLVHLKHRAVGRRAVIIGSELVSWSAVMTLRHAGCAVALMTTEYPRSDSYLAFNGPGRLAFRTRVATRTRLVKIIGRPVVEAVELEDLDTGRRRTTACDTVILTGSWIPDNELARAAGIPIDPMSKSPVVDTALRTVRDGVFAIGNLVHPVDTADVAALDGRAVAAHVRARLAGSTIGQGEIELRADEPFRWVSPQRVGTVAVDPPRQRLLLWADRYVRAPVVEVRQDGRVITRRRVWWPAAPGRVFRVPSDVLRSIDPAGGPVTIGLGS